MSSHDPLTFFRDWVNAPVLDRIDLAEQRLLAALPPKPALRLDFVIGPVAEQPTPKKGSP